MIFLASLISGFCFLAAESLLFKALDFSIGSSGIHLFLTVGVFIFASSLGTLASLKFKKVWLVEFLLSVLCLIAALGFPLLPEYLNLELKNNLLLTQNILTILITFPFAFLYGFTFPALAALSKKPILIYFYQALGGVLGLIFFEAFFFPNFGLLHSFLILAILHLITSGLLHPLNFKTEKFNKIELSNFGFFAGILNGVLQASLIYLSKLLIQPLFFTSTLVVLIMVLGLTKASMLPWKKLDYIKTIMVGMIFLFVGVNISLWFNIHQLPSFLKAGLLLILFFPLAVSIGGLFPYLIQSHHEKGKIIGLSLSISFGNLLGLIIFGIASAWIPLNYIWMIALLSLAIANSKVFSFNLAMLGLLGLFFSSQITDEKLIRLTSPSRGNFSVNKTFRSFNELSGVFSHEDAVGASTRRLYQNGFSPINLDYSLESVIVDVTKDLVTNKDNCLVLGVGSGKSAGTCTLYFNQTKAVDISLTVKDLALYLKEENYDLINNDKASYEVMDALLIPYNDNKSYDLIVLTTDPAIIYMATKLYSTEYFTALAKKLNQKGVFVFWLDQQLSPEGGQRIINSAKAAFKYQKFFSITKEGKESSYFLVINSQEEIKGKDLEDGIILSPTEEDNNLWSPHSSLLFNKKGSSHEPRR